MFIFFILGNAFCFPSLYFQFFHTLYFLTLNFCSFWLFFFNLKTFFFSFKTLFKNVKMIPSDSVILNVPWVFPSTNHVQYIKTSFKNLIFPRMLFFPGCWMFYVPFPKWFITLVARFASSYNGRNFQNSSTCK